MTNDEVSDWLYRIRSKGEVFMDETQNAKAKEAVATAIKALEQEPCEDCVSRQAVIIAINQNCIFENGYRLTLSQLKKLVQQLPPVTPQLTRWIPVSERLPEKNMPCILSIGKFHLTKIGTYSDLMGTIENKIFWIGEYGNSDFKDVTEYVKAWMPLPEPYKAESEK